jgi:hypothetical protein
MRSPALALTWEIWARHYRLNILGGAYLLLICLWGLLLPIPEGLVGLLLFPLIAGGMLAIGSAALGSQQARLESAASGLPARLLVLPVSSWTLAGVAFFWATLPVFLTALLYTRCILRPIAVDAPLFWPGLLMATLAAWLVVVTWMPFPLPGLRLVVASGLVVGFVVLGIVVGERHLPEGILAGCLLVQWPLAYGLMVVAVHRARRGEGVGARWPSLALPWRSRPRPRSFASVFGALLWLRRRARVSSFLVMCVICMVVCWPTVWFLEKVLLEKEWLLAYLDASHLSESMAVAWLALSPLLFVLALGMLLGGEVSIHEGPRGADFIFIQPVTNWQIIRVKLVAAALWLAGVWLAVVVTALSWAVSRGHLGDMTERVVTMAGGSAQALFLVAGVLAGLFLLSWAHMAAGLCIGLSGRGWVSLVAGCGACIVMMAIGSITIDCCINPVRNQWLPRILPPALVTLLLLKAVNVSLVWRALLRRGLATRPGLVAVGLAWVVGTMALGGLALWLAPAESISHWLLAAGVVLAVPLARPSLAPLALAWNRHR